MTGPDIRADANYKVGAAQMRITYALEALARGNTDEAAMHLAEALAALNYGAETDQPGGAQ